jgi:hypothetical protein
MGREAKHTTITIDGRAHAGDALLETDEVFVRVEGEAKRRKLPLRALTKLAARGTSLAFEHAGTRYEIEVGDAARWVEKIRSPKALLDKLGIANGSRVHVAGLDDDASFGALLTKAEVVRAPLDGDASVVVLGIRARTELTCVKRARKAVGDGLSLWIAYPKGKKELSEHHVRATAIAEGLVDVLVVRFSDERSALKLVVRKRERKPAPKPKAKAKA